MLCLRIWRLSLMVALLVLCLYPGAAVKRAPSGKSVKKTHSKPKAKVVEGGKKGSSPRPVPEPAPAAPEPPRPAPRAPHPPPILKSGDMTVNVRLKDGSLYPVPVNASAGMLGFRQQLLSAGLVGHAAEPLRLQRFHDGVRVSVPLNSTSELRGGDLVIIESYLNAQVPSCGGSGSRPSHWRPSEASFVPYPEHAWKGGKDNKAGSRTGRRTRTFDDISLYKVAAQPNASVSLLKLDQTAIKAFIDRLPSPPSDDEDSDSDSDSNSNPNGGGARVGLLFGRYNATSRHVSVDVIFEPAQHSDSNSNSKSDSNSNSKSKSNARANKGGYDESVLEGPEAQRATKVAAMLGLVPVGWVLANAHTGHRKALAPQDVLCSARLQLEVMKREGRDVGSAFVLVHVNTRHGVTPPPSDDKKGGKKKKKAKKEEKKAPADVSVEGYQVSRQCVQMLADGLLDPATPKSKLQGDTLPLTSDVFLNGQETKAVDSVYFTVPVGITTHRGPLKRASGPLANSRDLRPLLSDGGRVDARRLPLLLSDFHVLLRLSHYLRNEELERVCRGLEGAGVGGSKGAGRKGGKKKGAAGGGVAPAIAALVPLLEALCDEE